MKTKTQSKPENLRQEFKAKNEILRSKFHEISPQEYFDLVFSHKKDDELPVIFGALREGSAIRRKGTVKRFKLDEIWNIAIHSNAYIPYCDFKKNYYHTKTLERVRGFVVDCDGVTSTKLTKVLKYLWDVLPARPTHIVNSGKGVHFVYILSKPVEAKGLRWSINKLNSTIQDSFTELLEVDKHPVVHPYRFPGFQTKINTTATVFKIRGPYSFNELMERFKIAPMKKKQKKKKPADKTEVFVIPNGKRAFFEWVLRRLFKNPPIPGRRHNSFFALGIIAYKCKREVPYNEALETISMVYEDMSDRNLHLGFTIDEAYKAFHKGYKQKYVKATWKYLCELLGWEYRANKRRGKSREEHLQCLRKIRQIQKEQKAEKIKHLLEQGYSKTEIAEILGMSRRNLDKTYGYLFNR